MKRFFIAVKITAGSELNQAIGNIKESFPNSDIRWVNTDNLHITLKFLGDTPGKNTAAICTSLSSCASKLDSFYAEISGFGYFGTSRFPKVLWLGIKEKKAGSITTWLSTIDRAMHKMGYPSEAFSYSPHLTLGRVTRFADHLSLRETEAGFFDSVLQEVHFDRFLLMESKLKPSGPVYSVVEEFIIKN